MKNFNSKVFVILLSVLLIVASSADAQRKRKGSTTPKQDAAKFTTRTAVILSGVGGLVENKKVRTGYLKHARVLQAQAKKHIAKNELKQAVRKSYLGRRYGFIAYEANGGTIPQKWRMSKKESSDLAKYMANIPSDKELKEKLKEKKGEKKHGRKKAN